jgi:hypothetical protein
MKFTTNEKTSNLKKISAREVLFNNSLRLPIDPMEIMETFLKTFFHYSNIFDLLLGRYRGLVMGNRIIHGNVLKEMKKLK